MSTLILPIHDFEGNQVGKQIRVPGKNPVYSPQGIKVKQCAPYIGRIADGPMVIVCEGPTDCISILAVDGLSLWSVLGCWSATTIPDRDWWLRRFADRNVSVVACGDNDDSGQTFNQRIANVFGSAYSVKWPPLFRHKGDAREYISEYGADSFTTLVKSGTMREPWTASVHVGERRKHIQKHSGIISRLVADAGGEFCYTYGDGDSKWLCPLHNDVDDPSLTLNDETGSFCCWAGCGKGGPAQFIMAWKNVDYKSAIELLRLYV